MKERALLGSINKIVEERDAVSLRPHPDSAGVAKRFVFDLDQLLVGEGHGEQVAAIDRDRAAALVVHDVEVFANRQAARGEGDGPDGGRKVGLA